MSCIVCSKPSNYRCPTCKARYCSIDCFKTHKEACVEAPADPTPEPAAEAAPIPENHLYEKWLADPQIQHQLSSNALKHHLRLIAQIAEDPKLSGESTSEGRRFVAVKKLRELRAGGREQNEAVEEFAQSILSHARDGA